MKVYFKAGTISAESGSFLDGLLENAEISTDLNCSFIEVGSLDAFNESMQGTTLCLVTFFQRGETFLVNHPHEI